MGIVSIERAGTRCTAGERNRFNVFVNIEIDIAGRRRIDSCNISIGSVCAGMGGGVNGGYVRGLDFGSGTGERNGAVTFGEVEQAADTAESISMVTTVVGFKLVVGSGFDGYIGAARQAYYDITIDISGRDKICIRYSGIYRLSMSRCRQT